MATHQTDPTLEHEPGAPGREEPPIPGIAHLTVVPANAEDA
ncbi:MULTISPECIES: hypothetical protein [Haloarcula]|jgi:hypothetical protein|nr:hypothetical protein [Halomicroarcula sp. XH51]